MAILTTTNVNAALLVKRTVSTEQCVDAPPATATPTNSTTMWQKVARHAAYALQLPTGHKRHNMGELPKGIYIAMCILPLGWLAIAINSNFTENEWIFALLWYVLLYLPGVYYSLRQMKRFYGR